MPDNKDKPQIYFIPENFIAEARIGSGQIRFPLRKLIDAIVFVLILGILVLLILHFFFRESDNGTKIVVVTVFVAPGFMLGISGIDGEPVSSVIVCWYKWRKKRHRILFNTKPRLLGTDPVKAITSCGGSFSKIVNRYRDWEKTKAEKLLNEEMVEGKTFRFEYDPNIDGFVDENGDYDIRDDNGIVEISSDYDLSSIQNLWRSEEQPGIDDPEEFEWKEGNDYM